MNILLKDDPRNGFILIMVLWVLGFLTVLALAIGFGTRQKIILLERLEDRNRAQLAAEAGVKKAIAILIDDLENNQFIYSAKAKERRHNNPKDFSNIPVGYDAFSVTYDTPDEKTGMLSERYGLGDEQSKINLNTTSRETLARLLGDVLGLQTAEARTLADNIIDWRDYGQHEVVGFFSDDYYKGLEFPYELKEGKFERLDELLLVKGVDRPIYEKLLPYVTIYGDGLININIVSKKILMALGLDPAVADKILQVRCGADGIEATADDHIFYRTFDIASEVNAIVKLGELETRQIDALNKANILKTDSFYYSIRSRYVPSDGKGGGRTITAVFNVLNNKVEYWYEK